MKAKEIVKDSELLKEVIRECSRRGLISNFLPDPKDLPIDKKQIYEWAFSELRDFMQFLLILYLGEDYKIEIFHRSLGSSFFDISKNHYLEKSILIALSGQPSENFEYWELFIDYLQEEWEVIGCNR